MFNYRKQTVRNLGFFWCFLYINPTVRRRQCKRWFIGSNHILPILKCTAFMFVTPLPFQFIVGVLFEIFCNYSPSVNIRSSRYTVFDETVLLKWMLSSAINFTAVILCCLVIILFNVRPSLFANFGFHPQFLFDDDVFPCLVDASLTWMSFSCLRHTLSCWANSPYFKVSKITYFTALRTVA